MAAIRARHSLPLNNVALDPRSRALPCRTIERLAQQAEDAGPNRTLGRQSAHLGHLVAVPHPTPFGYTRTPEPTARTTESGTAPCITLHSGP